MTTAIAVWKIKLCCTVLYCAVTPPRIITKWLY